MSGTFESVQWNACVHRLDLSLYSHPKESWGNGVKTHVNSKGKIPSTRKILLRGGSNPQCCIKKDSEPNTVPLSYSDHPSLPLLCLSFCLLLVLIVLVCIDDLFFAQAMFSFAFFVSHKCVCTIQYHKTFHHVWNCAQKATRMNWLTVRKHDFIRQHHRATLSFPTHHHPHISDQQQCTHCCQNKCYCHANSKPTSCLSSLSPSPLPFLVSRSPPPPPPPPISLSPTSLSLSLSVKSVYMCMYTCMNTDVYIHTRQKGLCAYYLFTISICINL